MEEMTAALSYGSFRFGSKQQGINSFPLYTAPFRTTPPRGGSQGKPLAFEAAKDRYKEAARWHVGTLPTTRNATASLQLLSPRRKMSSPLKNWRA